MEGMSDYQQGLAKAKEKDYEGAIAAFSQALQHQSDFAEAYYNRGLAYFNVGDWQAAIADYTAALRLDGHNAAVYFARGLTYLTTRDLEAAIADAKQAILLNADHAAAYNLIGTARQRQGAASKAIASYKKAVELYLDQRDIVNCRRCLGHIRELQATSQSHQAPDPSKQSTSPLPPLIDPHEFLQQAMQKAQQQNYRGAMEDLDWAIEIDPQDAQAYANRGQVRAILGDWQGAIEDSEQAGSLFTKQSDQTMAQHMQERIQTFQASLQQATKRARADAARLRAKRSLLEGGRPSRAVQRQLLQLVGDDRKIAVGLVQRLKLKHPGMPEDWYWEKAIYDLNRDRGR